MNTPPSQQSEADLVKEFGLKFNITSEQAQNLYDWLVEEDEISGDVEEAIYSFYMDSGEMPYGAAKGDPYEWVNAHLKREYNL